MPGALRPRVDDFHPNLLRDYPVDVAKVDRSFVTQMGKDREVEAIVRAVLDLARSLQIESVAEGVETTAQVELLKLAGCEIAQGYLFGRAVDAKVMAATLRQRAAA